MDRRSFLARAGALALMGASAALLAPGCSMLGSGSANPDDVSWSQTDTPFSAVNGERLSSAGALAAVSDGPKPSSTILVAYYSGLGHTARIATQVARALSADVFIIEPDPAYASDDLDWTNEDSRVRMEHDEADGVAPDVSLVQNVPNRFDSYETVIVGFAVWWGEAAWPAQAFVRANDFSGKTVIPFFTSYGPCDAAAIGANLSGLGTGGTWQDPIRFEQDASLSAALDWADSLNPEVPGEWRSTVLVGSEGDTIPYSYYLPKDYDEGETYRLVVNDGGYNSSWQGDAYVGQNVHEPLSTAWAKLDEPIIIAAPQLATEGEEAARQTHDVVKHMMDSYAVDPKRVHCLGYSSGGEACSIEASEHPGTYASFLCIAAKWTGSYKPVAESRLPVYLFIGDSDEAYTAEPTKEVYSTLHGLYVDQGLSETDIDGLLKLDVRSRADFDALGWSEEHATSGYFASQNSDIQSWFLSKSR